MDRRDGSSILHHPQRLRSFLVGHFRSGHAPQALIGVLGLLRPFTGREHHNRGVRGTYTDVGDRRQPRERRAQLGLARLRGVAGPGDLADARRVVVLGPRGQAALPPFCSAVLRRRRHRICGAPLHLSCSGGARVGGLRAASRLPRCRSASLTARPRTHFQARFSKVKPIQTYIEQ